MDPQAQPQTPTQTPVEKLEARYPEAAALFGADTILNTVQDYGVQIPAPDVFSFLAYQRGEEAGIPQEQSDLVQMMSESLVQADPLTGFDKPHYKELNLLLAQAQKKEAAAQGEDLPVFYLGCDVSNLRGLNLALSGADVQTPGDAAITAEGREHTNQFLKLFAGIMEKETLKSVQDAQAAGSQAQVNFYRDGGDELSAIIVGLPGSSVMEIQERINRNVEDVVMGAGLDNLLHPKHPYMGDRAGVGLACAMAEVMDDTELEALGLAVDTEIEKMRTKKKSKKTTSTTLRTNLEEIEIQHAMDAAREKAAQHEIDLMQEKLQNPFPFEDVTPLLASAGMGADDFVWPQLRRQMQVEAAIAEAGVSGEAETLLRGLLDIYESRDPVTGCERQSPMGIFSDGLDFLQSNPGESMHALVFEMQNFAGLNEALGHSGCDQMFSQLASRIQLPSDQVMLFRPDGTGDRIYGFVRGASTDELVQSVNTMNAATDVVTAVNGISHLKNPRYTEKGYEGVQFVTAALELGSDGINRPGEVFRQLDGQLRDNKENQVRFSGEALGLPDSKTPYVHAEKVGNQRTARDEVRVPPYVLKHFPREQSGGHER